jgi:hypothetical protein
MLRKVYVIGGSWMKVVRKDEFILNEDIPDYELDLYAEGLDDEEAMELGLKPEEAAFLRGFKGHN